MAMKGKVESIYTLSHVDEFPAEITQLVGDATEKKADDTPAKEPKEKREKYQDDHSKLPFQVDWEGAPEFQWRIFDTPKESKTLLIENAEVSDLYEPFIYRTSLRAESVHIKMPGRIIEDQPTAKHLGSISLMFLVDNMVMPQAMLNLIYSRAEEGRRLKIYLPQNKPNLLRRQEFESRLGRKIEYTDAMRKIMVKMEEKSLEGVQFGVEEASKAFPKAEVESVEAVKDFQENTCFLVTMKTAQDAVQAHANTRHVKLGELSARVYMVGVEVFDADKTPAFATRMERQRVSKEKAALKRKENESDKSGPPAKKAHVEKNGSTRPARGATSTRGRGRGGRQNNDSSRPIDKSPFKSPSIRGAPSGRGFPSRRSTEFNRDRGSHSYRGSTSVIKPFDNSRGQLDSMVREQRQQLAMQEQIMRQQQMINAMTDRLRDRDPPAYRQPQLSTSAFDRPAYHSSTSMNSYNKATDYVPSPQYEPLSYSATPSHLSNYNNSSSSSYSNYGKQPSSSGYRDGRNY